MPTGSSRPMFINSASCALFHVDACTSPRTARRSPCSGRPALGLALDAEDPGHDHVERDRLHPRCQRDRRVERPAVDLAVGGLDDHLLVARDRLAVERRQQQLALAQVARADRGQHRVGADDRPQRRLAGQRRRLVGLGGEERLHVIGMRGDHRARRARCPASGRPRRGARRAPKTNSIWRWLKRSVCSTRGRSICGGGGQRRRLGLVDRPGGRGRRGADQRLDDGRGFGSEAHDTDQCATESVSRLCGSARS